jgi:pre-rRNA-processing protein RIX1
MTLTKIYCMTHVYQTLVREITTPTLPTFITSCLNLISARSKSQIVSSSLEEVVFQSFAILVPRHTTIYRPFVSQIRPILRPYLAPTSFDGSFVSMELKQSARRLDVILHQTAPKNTGGEEWAKAVRELVRDTHSTADLVFRAVIEDWESSSGYQADPVDVNIELRGGDKTPGDLPAWAGIYAGTERLAGLLEYLAAYFKSETSTPVAMPLGSISDMIARMLSISIPWPDSSATGGPRLHPAIDRDEKDGLFAGLSEVYVGALHLLDAIAERLQESFMPLAQGIFDQLTWVFPYGKHSIEFRQLAYRLLTKILRNIGPSFNRSQAPKLSTVIKTCCHDLFSQEPSTKSTKITATDSKKSQSSGSSHNADALLRKIGDSPVEVSIDNPELSAAAGELLPLFMSHFPQQHFDISMRSLIERTAILSHNKDAMLASILNPFVGKNGRALPTILPHLARDFPDDNVVEILLRPRMPLLPSKSASLPSSNPIDDASEDEDMDINPEPISTHQPLEATPSANPSLTTFHPGLGPPQDHLGTHAEAPLQVPTVTSTYTKTPTQTIPPPDQQDVNMGQGDSDTSDDESVHLVMQLDSDSEGET